MKDSRISSSSRRGLLEATAGIANTAAVVYASAERYE